MKTVHNKIMATASALAILGLATPAHAATPEAGTTITNTASISYTLGTSTGLSASGTNTITVDRKIDLTVTWDGNVTNISNGGTAALKFTVTNQTNGTIDILLAAANETSGDTADVGSTFSFYTAGANGTYDGGTGDDVLITKLDNVTAGTATVVYVKANGIAATDGSTAKVTLTGTAADKDTGTAFTETGSTSPDTVGTVDNVFADLLTTNGNVAKDGKGLDTGSFTVVNKALTVTKTSKAVYDPITGTSANAKMIPGAIVQYCITVANPSGNADATSVVVTDNVPTNMTYSATTDGSTSFGVKTGTDCSTFTGTGSESGGTVTGNLGTVSGGTSETVVFHAKID